MPGIQVFTDKVAANTVRLATNKLAITRILSRSHERTFNEGEPIGDTLRVRLANQGTIREGFDYVGENMNRQYTTITADQKFGIDVEADVVEKALQIVRSGGMFPSDVMDSLSAKIAQEIDTRCARFIVQNTPMTTGAIGTTPTSLATWSNAGTRIEEKGGFTGTKRAGMFMSPQDQETMVAGTPNVLGLFHNDSKSDPTRVFRKGFIADYGGWALEKSMSLPSHTTGIVATQTSVDVTSYDGTTLVCACTTGDTFKKGDRISIENVNDVNLMTKASLSREKQGVILQDAVGVANSVSLLVSFGQGSLSGLIGPGSPYQNCTALPVAGAAVTFNPGTTMVDGAAKTGKFAIALTDEAFGLVNIKIPQPKRSAFEESGTYVDEETGIGISFLGWYDPATLGRKYRMDVWLGFGAFKADTDAIVIASLR